MTETNYSDAVNCSNPECYGGGVLLSFLMHDMVRARKTEGSFKEFCRGYEGSPKGRKRYRKCMYSFAGKIQIEYKPEPEAPNSTGSNRL
jgi:hypothetical protein